jgi:hypothetical protein
MALIINSIPASVLVSVEPSVLSAGGAALSLSGVLLTESTRVPVGQVFSFASAAAVGSYFGLTSNEYNASLVYFAGFSGATATPGALLFAQYPTAPVAAYLRGGSVSGLTLIQLQALTGTLAITVNGTVETSSNISLASATSFSNAATLILAGFTAPAFTVTYDSVSGGFVFTSSTDGATSTIAFPETGTLATDLALTQATGAVLSQGAVAGTPGPFMSGITAVTQNWATFSHLFDPDAVGETGNVQKMLFAAWANSQNDRFAYFPVDNDITATEQESTTCMGALLAASDFSGTAVFYEPAGPMLFNAVFAMAIAAALNFNVANGATDFAYRTQTGLAVAVTSQEIQANLVANGYNFYGTFATATTPGNIIYPGSISGPFAWIDAFVEQIWLNAAMQQVLFLLPQQIGTIPFNQYGAGLIESSLYGTPQSPGPIDAAIAFGAIQSGVTLSAAQVQALNNAAGGLNIAATLQTRGWYLLVNVPPPQVRASRGPWPIQFWYTQGGSVQTFNLSSVLVA